MHLMKETIFSFMHTQQALNRLLRNKSNIYTNCISIGISILALDYKFSKYVSPQLSRQKNKDPEDRNVEQTVSTN